LRIADRQLKICSTIAPFLSSERICGASAFLPAKLDQSPVAFACPDKA
jgi:hypothetical protein